MRLIVGISLVLCLVFLVDRAEANTSIMEVMNRIGGLDGIVAALNVIVTVCMKMMQAFETMIRNGMNVIQAFPEVMRLLPQMLPGCNVLVTSSPGVPLAGC
ncbi:uncharacterized protein LOC128879439 [Hylaeus volcanicus]|uniref:uncharacterized protein LOC128879439 n=1 Tax=Hylaeus volcanicus TaxID=313075 RepID=UPI0023B7F7F9|nr:uncharacterized protein LOC128879439 [Hylaeus volcanicus]